MAGLMLAKVNTTFAALCHALVYSLPFLLLSPSAAAIAAIAISHFLIDRFRLARLVAFAKNKVTDGRLALLRPSAASIDHSTDLWDARQRCRFACIAYGTNGHRAAGASPPGASLNPTASALPSAASAAALRRPTLWRRAA